MIGSCKLKKKNTKKTQQQCFAIWRHSVIYTSGVELATSCRVVLILKAMLGSDKHQRYKGEHISMRKIYA